MRGVKRILLSISLILLAILGTFIFDKYQSITCNNSSKNLPIYSVEREDKKVSLTFDVNWAKEENIYNILDILDKYNVKGTFFIMGGWVEYSPENVEKIKAIAERRHEIGNHSYMHPQYTKLGREKMLLEADKTDEVIEKYIGSRPKLFRFPSGDYNDLAVKTMEEKYFLIQWSVDSVDWKELGYDIEYKRIKTGIKPGSILLFHNNAKYTPKNLDRLIDEYQKEGYEFVSIGELIYDENYYIDEQGKQILK